MIGILSLIPKSKSKGVALSCMSMALLTACSPTIKSTLTPHDDQNTLIKPNRYTIDFSESNAPLTLGWRRLDIRNDEDMISRLYIPEGASADTLKEFINFEALYHNEKSQALESVALQAKHDADLDCKQVDWQMQTPNAHEITFTIRAHQCKSSEDYVNVGHLFGRGNDYYFLYYSAHLNNVSTAEQNQFENLIKNSRLTATPIDD